jgi:hypothetical protein
MFFALVHLSLRHVVRLIVGSSNEQMDTQVELVILRPSWSSSARWAGRIFVVATGYS